MAVFMGAFPILPGKADEGRKFAQETAARRDEYAESQVRAGVTKEEWSLQETPMGALMLVRFEAADVDAAFTQLATSTDEFSVWFRGRIMDVTGLDMSKPAEGPPPEIVFDWSA